MIAAGANHTLALKADGTVVAWGYNDSGQINVPSGLIDVVAIEAKGEKNIALKADGAMVIWGDSSDGQTIVPPGLTNVVAIGAGDAHTLAVKQDGTVVSWGRNNYGQTNVPASLGQSIAVAATGGSYHSLALLDALPSMSSSLPTSQAVNSGTNATLTIMARGPSLAYQWYKDGVPIAGATNASLTLSPIVTGSAGLYSVGISNAFGNLLTGPTAMLVDGRPLLPPQVARTDSNGNFVFQIYGLNGELAVVEASSDLIHWQPVATNTVTSGLISFSDPTIGTLTNRYYRVLVSP